MGTHAMTEQITDVPNSLSWRKARTRAALVRAAQSSMAAGKPTAPILEITQAADVGMGSFYNHFQTTEELSLAAVEEALARHGATLDELPIGREHAAEVFAQSLHLTGRPYRRSPGPSNAVHPRADTSSAGC